MNNDQFVRYKALDRCLRRTYSLCDMEQLVKECKKAVQSYHMGDMERKVSRRTVENDLRDLKLYYDVKLRDGLKDGKKKLYQYENTSFSLMNKLLADGKLEQMMLKNVIDALTIYDSPQYKWLKIFVEKQLNDKKVNNNLAVDFQNNPELHGLNHFDDLIKAILNKQPIKIEYQTYNGKRRTYQTHPYLLKQYNDRWFLICRNEGYENLTNFAIDRIQTIEQSDIPYQPIGLDIKKYFENVVGVSRDVRKPIENVKIRISRSRFPYVKSKPLHSTQTTIDAECNDKFCVISLCVQVNKELEAQILSLGNDAVVIAPQSLRDSIATLVKDLYKKYVDNDI